MQNELKEVSFFHEQAMDFAERADEAKRRGDQEMQRMNLEKAFNLERDVAMAYAGDEFSKSVLYRSAASLASELGKWEEAEKLACAGLVVSTDDEITTELRDILREAMSYLDPHEEPDRLRYVIFDIDAQEEVKLEPSNEFLLPEQERELDEVLDHLGSGNFIVVGRPAYMRVKETTPNPSWTMTLEEVDEGELDWDDVNHASEETSMSFLNDEPDQE